MGVGERKTRRKSGRVTRSRTYTVFVDTGERYPPTEKYPKGRKKYKRIVRSLGPVYKVSKTAAKEIFKKEESKYKKTKAVFDSPTLFDFISRYIEHKQHAEGKRSWQRDRFALNRIAEYFGPVIKLSDITSKHIDEYKAHRQKKASPKTINNELGCLRNLYNLAAAWGEYEGENPVSRAGLIKKIVRDKRKPPTQGEETLLINKLNPNIR